MPEWSPQPTAWLGPDAIQELISKIPADASQRQRAWVLRRIRWLAQTLGAVDIQGNPKPRPNLIPPSNAWGFMLLGGRGSGKTRSLVEDDSEFARNFPDTRTALVAPTYAGMRDVLVEGESGLLSILPPSALRGGSIETAWNRSIGELYLSNGAQFNGYSSEKPGNLRGPQFHRAHVDEPAQFKDAKFKLSHPNTTWSNLVLALRLIRPPAMNRFPRVVISGTPLPNELIEGLVAHPRVLVSRASTFDNLANLDEEFKTLVLDMFAGTRLEAQEIFGMIVGDVEGALWTQEDIDAHRIDQASYLLIPDENGVDQLTPILPKMVIKVVAIDPSEGGEAGICVGGVDEAGRGWVLEDLSKTSKPEEWARIAVDAYHRWDCVGIVAEMNMPSKTRVTDVIRSIPEGKAVPLYPVRASHDKYTRATPVLSLWSQYKVMMGGYFPLLEKQMTTWVPPIPVNPEPSKWSPNRIDAFVWAFTYLMIRHSRIPNRGRITAIGETRLPSISLDNQPR